LWRGRTCGYYNLGEEEVISWSVQYTVISKEERIRFVACVIGRFVCAHRERESFQRELLQ
jgi:hypothetical protein